MDKISILSGIVLISACLISSCSFNPANSKDIASIARTNNITINTRDGLDISVQYYLPKKEGKYPAVLLLHMLGKDKSSWNKIIPALITNGYAVFNADLRGHGRSTRMQNGQEVFYQNMNELDWLKIPDDVTDIVNFISIDDNIDPNRISIMGASIGANAAIIVSAKNPEKVKSVVAISPGLDYHGIETLKSAESLKSPLLIAVAEGDTYSYNSSNQLNAVVNEKHNLLIYRGNDHGTNLLNSNTDLEHKVINWLNEQK